MADASREMRDVGREDPELRISHRVSCISNPVFRISYLASRVASFIVNPMKRVLREPLIHFLLIGAVLFAVDHYVQPARGAAPSSKQIQLSLDDLGQLMMLFQAQWRRPPTPRKTRPFRSEIGIKSGNSTRAHVVKLVDTLA